MAVDRRGPSFVLGTANGEVIRVSNLLVAWGEVYGQLQG